MKRNSIDLMITVEQLINSLDLQPHPEGGYFKETYRSDIVIPQNCLPEAFNSGRNCCTGIYYLLQSGDFSAFHRINQDEMWHFYLGDAIEIIVIHDDGMLETIVIGNDVMNQEVLQYTIPKKQWFAARVLQPNSFALVGCTVSPGFDFADFELGSYDALVEAFPQHQKIIKALTRQ